MSTFYFFEILPKEQGIMDIALPPLPKNLADDKELLRRFYG
jgi:hypothetical protein